MELQETSWVVLLVMVLLRQIIKTQIKYEAYFTCVHPKVRYLWTHWRFVILYK